MKRILIVDDQSVIRWMIRLALREYFEVDEAENGHGAWGKIKKQRPDGIVLDVLLQGSAEGFELCRRIRQDPDLAGINIVLVTGCDDERDRERGRLAGADAYFVKPVSPVALLRHFLTFLGTDRAVLKSSVNSTEKRP